MVQALKKPYPGAPLPLVTMGSKGFNVSSSGQDSQARIPQFFNFVGSNAGDGHTVNKSPVNVSATSSRISKSPLASTPELQKRPKEGGERGREMRSGNVYYYVMTL